MSGLWRSFECMELHTVRMNNDMHVLGCDGIRVANCQISIGVTRGSHYWT